MAVRDDHGGGVAVKRLLEAVLRLTRALLELLARGHVLEHDHHLVAANRIRRDREQRFVDADLEPLGPAPGAHPREHLEQLEQAAAERLERGVAVENVDPDDLVVLEDQTAARRTRRQMVEQDPIGVRQCRV